MNPFDQLDAAFAAQFGALPPITQPMSLSEAREQRNREAVDGLCVEENDHEQ
ncbi:hypothetical protein [Stenotrophomonas maltophilia]|uniref:hypothetical protein n=1 Tax=Stenotrophomonas maltophilia TaxID=40324 RepID=UPI001F325489|nr:hypothetical protein [Stenotrophomonas maltophilia]MCF3455378.1 hypothetical protein [Stenotrophomonas maltophilia]MCF3540819.1 hypothetical protein [Stenotrophomonas maltophilia]